jgi:hypothetical protein
MEKSIPAPLQTRVASDEVTQNWIALILSCLNHLRTELLVLEKAGIRGVEINIIPESPEASDGKITFDTISVWGPALRSATKVFVWPTLNAKSPLMENPCLQKHCAGIGSYWKFSYLPRLDKSGYCGE